MTEERHGDGPKHEYSLVGDSFDAVDGPASSVRHVTVFGNVMFDLRSAAPLYDGGVLDVCASVGVGDVVVVVPDGVKVSVSGVRLLGGRSEDFNPSGAANGTVRVKANIAVGQLKIIAGSGMANSMVRRPGRRWAQVAYGNGALGAVTGPCTSVSSSVPPG